MPKKCDERYFDEFTERLDPLQCVQLALATSPTSTYPHKINKYLYAKFTLERTLPTKSYKIYYRRYANSAGRICYSSIPSANH